MDVEVMKKLTDLANIQIEVGEIESFSREMDSILGYMEQLRNIDADDLEPMEHVLPLNNAFREDMETESINRSELNKNTPINQDGCFKVPMAVES